MNQSKKIIYIINHMDWFWSHRLPLALGAKDAGWDVVIAATGAEQDARLKGHGFGAADLPPADKGFAPFTALKIIMSIKSLIKAEQPTLIHAITLKYAFLAGLAARFYPKLNVVHTVAGLGYLFSGEGTKPKILRMIVGPFLRLALKHPRAKIIFQNPDDMDLLIKRGFVRREGISLIRGSGVDIDQFSVHKKPDEGEPIVLMPTRLVHDKGVAVFIEAARILKQRGVNAKFQIAGGESPNNPLSITAKEMDSMIKGSGAHWLGQVSDMPALLASVTLIAYPSYYREGIPKVLLESCASGLAIVTTDHSGCREAVHDGENGLLVPIKDAQKTADAIYEILSDADKRKSMEKKARQRAEEEFDVRIIVKKTLAVYTN